MGLLDLLNRTLPAAGRVLYRGPIPPPLTSIAWPPQVRVTELPPSDPHAWRAEVRHPRWGSAEVGGLRPGPPLDFDLLFDISMSLTAGEKALAREGRSAIGVRLASSRGRVLADRKHLLQWLQVLLGAGGVAAIDDVSTLPWSAAMLDDELAHDADLDVEALYTLHAVKAEDDSGMVAWLHTHGLEEVGAFDLDILQPSQTLMAGIGDPMRSLACAALEGLASPGDDRYEAAHPGGVVRLVPASDFNRLASDAHRALRSDDATHSGRRVVLCEPVGFLGRWRRAPVPSRFLSTLDTDRLVFPFSEGATALGAERARRTVPVLRRLAEEFAEFDLPVLAKFGYETDGGSREHLWFQCHAIHDGHADATLVNRPFDIAALKEGERGSHPFDRLSDWQILSPAGSMTPRNVSAARLLRERADEVREFLRSSRERS